jgi:hypothetical protein
MNYDHDLIRRDAGMLLDAAERLPGIDPAVRFEMAAILAWAGAKPEPIASPLARAFYNFAVTGSAGSALALAEPDRTDALILLASACSAETALEIAAALDTLGTSPPLSPNFSAALAAASPSAWERLLVQVATSFDPGVYAETLVEGLLAGQDAGVELPSGAHEAWDRLLAVPGSAEVEVYVGRLRFAARSDPAGSLDLLDEAIGAVGADAVAVGADAVLGRLASLDSTAAGRFIREGPWQIEERAQLLHSAVWEIRSASLSLEFAALVASLEADHDTTARELWLATFHLLAISARLGDADAAVRIVSATEPAHWMVWNAVWAPLRKRGEHPTRFVDAIHSALVNSGQGAAGRYKPMPPSVAKLTPEEVHRYIRLKALPIPGVPWWCPWGGGLP